jgi:hypothetical protein
VETLGNRAAAITFATLALVVIGYYFGVVAMASATAPVHCSGGHLPLTCTSDGKTLALTSSALNQI